MFENPFAVFKRLVGRAPVVYGEVIDVDGELATVELHGGGRLHARGAATVGQKVYVRDGVIESEAPDLPTVEIEL